MKKEIFVTAGLCRIKEQIALSAADSENQSGETDEALPDPPVSVFDRLPDTTAKALRSRWQEYEHFRQDLTFRLHELSSRIARQSEETEKNAENLQNMKMEVSLLLERMEKQPEPDEFSADFQLRLSENFRQLEHLRLKLIDIQSPLTEKQPAENRSGLNLFAELDSVTFGQLFRLGAALMLPLILMILFSSLLLIVAILLTFRVNL